MNDYAEMAKLAKRIEFLESRETLNGADSWLRLEERITDLENLHYKGVYPEAHNYPESVHNERTTGEAR